MTENPKLVLLVRRLCIGKGLLQSAHNLDENDLLLAGCASAPEVILRISNTIEEVIPQTFDSTRLKILEMALNPHGMYEGDLLEERRRLVSMKISGLHYRTVVRYEEIGAFQLAQILQT